MAKITIEELYRGEKYDIMSAVTAKALMLGIDERTEEGRTWIEMELVRQTVIAIEQMKKNGDCIAGGKLDKDPLNMYTYPFLKIDKAYELFESNRHGVIQVAVEC